MVCINMINRIELLLGWALRLERVGRRSEAAERLRAAAVIAEEIEAPWPHSLFPNRDRPAAEAEPMVAAAHGLAHPHARHVDVLCRVLDAAVRTVDRILVAIALARCQESNGRPDQSVRVLRRVSAQLAGDSSEPAFALFLAHELARLASARETRTAYVDVLESELWALHQARLLTIQTRIGHERLARRHDETQRLALRDPLTDLPNRQALDDLLGDAGREPGQWLPLAVALLDVDNFKQVNDRGSHAEGDDLLRAIAATLHGSMREDDVVTRYGGDEFVVLLRRTNLAAAQATLVRAAHAIAAHPLARRYRITVSAGLTTYRSGEPPGVVLDRADSAMYQAKRDGGNRVRTLIAG
jgi:diguanylate cyclase